MLRYQSPEFEAFSEIRNALERIEASLREITSMAEGAHALLTKKGVARLLAVSVRSVDRLVASGELPPGTPVGGLLRWNRRDVLRAFGQEQAS